MDATFVPVSEAKAQLSALVREAADRDVLLMRHSRPAAVLLSYDRYQALLARIDAADSAAG